MECQEVPYPAMRWEWKTIMSFPWDLEAHINELEMAALVAVVKHRSRSANNCGRRWFLVVDYMVTRRALAKGRSPSRRLNRLLCRQAATQVAMDSYLFPLWTISRWNFSDAASRHLKSKKSLRYAGLDVTTLQAYKRALSPIPNAQSESSVPLS
jgi:hypothetical protein